MLLFFFYSGVLFPDLRVTGSCYFHIISILLLGRLSDYKARVIYFFGVSILLHYFCCVGWERSIYIRIIFIQTLNDVGFTLTN